MRKTIGNIILALFLALLLPNKVMAAEEFAVGKNTFMLNGKPFVVKAAEVHYPRIPRPYWEQRIKDRLKLEGPQTHRLQGQTLDLSGEQPIHSGTLKSGNGWQEVRFDKPVSGRYLCIEALNSHWNREYCCISGRQPDAVGAPALGSQLAGLQPEHTPARRQIHFGGQCLRSIHQQREQQGIRLR